jgi:methylase of polypeptide subunit release factors
MTEKRQITIALEQGQKTYVEAAKTGGYHVVTDKVEYDQPDQVFPIHPENLFYLDQLCEKVEGARVLEIGLGSGVLTIGALKAGAEEVVALEINPRAKVFAQYNIAQNGVEGKIEIRQGDVDCVLAPVEGERFDYIVSNPPFEPTPEGIEYYMHSAGGVYGLDFVEEMFKGLDEHLADDGHAQIITFAPGDDKVPYMLVELVEKHLEGRAEIVVDPVAMRFDEFVDRFVEIGKATQEQVDAMKMKAQADGVTHLHMCMVHYEKGKQSIDLRTSEKQYLRWDLPLGADVPMGYGGE